jgi:CRP-like cAMP-binding protein
LDILVFCNFHILILNFLIFLAGLSNEAIITAAQSMEEVFFKKWDVIIEQDEIGDSFYILEEGLVSVSVITFLIV